MFYLIDKCGDHRTIVAVYATREAAMKAKGAIYAVVTGDGLEVGQTMRRGELKAALQGSNAPGPNGKNDVRPARIQIADGTDVYALAGA